MARDIATYEKALKTGRQVESEQRSAREGSFFETKKPSKAGEQLRQRIRAIPRLKEGVAQDEFWLIVAQHYFKADGKTKTVGCMDGLRDFSAEPVCPICVLVRDLYKTKNKEYMAIAKELGASTKVLQNVIDLDEPDKGVQVWGCSRAVHLALMDICCVKRSFIEDPEVGRDIFLTTRRIGPDKKDIRYSVTDSDSCPLDAAHHGMLAEAGDLESFEETTSFEELAQIADMNDPRPVGSRTRAPMSAPPAAAPPAAAPAAPVPAAAAPPPAPAPTPAPAPAAAPVEDPKWHYTGKAGTVQGVTASHIVGQIVANRDGDHFVWTEGFDGWLDPLEVAEIRNLVPPAAPAGPPPPPPASAAAAGPPPPPAIGEDQIPF